MKTIVYYYCLYYIYLIIFTLDGGALFRVHMEARTRVLTEMLEIRLHKNEVGGYAYTDANTLLKQIEPVLERHLIKDSSDRMKGLTSDKRNVLNEYKSTINIKKKDVLCGIKIGCRSDQKQRQHLRTKNQNQQRCQGQSQQTKRFPMESPRSLEKT